MLSFLVYRFLYVRARSIGMHRDYYGNSGATKTLWQVLGLALSRRCRRTRRSPPVAINEGTPESSLPFVRSCLSSYYRGLICSFPWFVMTRGFISYQCGNPCTSTVWGHVGQELNYAHPVLSGANRETDISKLKLKPLSILTTYISPSPVRI